MKENRGRELERYVIIITMAVVVAVVGTVAATILLYHE
jgi:hypothetical protein